MKDNAIDIFKKIQELDIIKNDYYKLKIKNFFNKLKNIANVDFILSSDKDSKIILECFSSDYNKLFDNLPHLNEEKEKIVDCLVKKVEFKNDFLIKQNKHGFFFASIPVHSHSIVLLVSQFFFTTPSLEDFKKLQEENPIIAEVLVNFLKTKKKYEEVEFRQLIDFVAYSFITLLDTVAEYMLSESNLNINKSLSDIEKENRYYNQIIQQIFKNSITGMLISEIETGKILEVNDAFCEMMDYSKDEMLLKTSAELGFYEDNQIRKSLLSRLNKNGSLNKVEVNLIGKRHKRVVVNASVTVVEYQERDCLLIILDDITRTYEIENLLKINNTIFNTIFDNLKEIVFLLDKSKIVTYANQACFDFLRDNNLLTTIIGLDVKSAFPLITQEQEEEYDDVIKSFKTIEKVEEIFDIRDKKFYVRKIPIIFDTDLIYIATLISENNE